MKYLVTNLENYSEIVDVKHFETGHVLEREIADHYRKKEEVVEVSVLDPRKSYRLSRKEESLFEKYEFARVEERTLKTLDGDKTIKHVKFDPGCPDILVSYEDSVRFIEVKSVTDTLKINQFKILLSNSNVSIAFSDPQGDIKSILGESL